VFVINAGILRLDMEDPSIWPAKFKPVRRYDLRTADRGSVRIASATGRRLGGTFRQG
jgi:hypothetical protein